MERKREMTVKEISEHFNVTTVAVRHWIKKYDIPFETKRIIGVKPRMVIDLCKVYEKLNIMEVVN